MATEWWQKSNGVILRELEFTVHVFAGGREQELKLKVPSPPLYDQDPNLFTRLDFDFIRFWFARECFMEVGHIIRGEVLPNGSVRDCYVYAPGARVPFATIRPSVFEPR